MRTLRQFGIILGAVLLMAAARSPIAKAGVTCADFPDWCPLGISKVHHPAPPSGGDHSTPAPGALGLLALGSIVGIARMRRRRKKD